METAKLKTKERLEELRLSRRKVAKPVLYVGIISIVMLFAGLTSAYVVRADNGNWLEFQLPSITILSTGIMVTSSLTLILAVLAIKRNNLGMTSVFIGITLILGFSFIYTQFEAWRQLTEQQIYFVGKYSNAAGSFLYLIGLVHLLHLGGGIIALLFTLVKSLRKKYSKEDYLGIELAAIYWHFLDLLWVYLFLFLYNYR